ncbi:hypothetical protein BD31_I1120 [Candidatus Nitrosopumilus salaria BD31]|uniref:Uncharacterized protein n=1 Tax=Candidatus Nitrosopumilus salarius BD31 TaxID=859350 RepID=I3D4N4_9ARCH|nr:hypothetical protein BD31_I1120 [Candidatus Nitrosopumilus salaria BD31]
MIFEINKICETRGIWDIFELKMRLWRFSHFGDKIDTVKNKKR